MTVPDQIESGALVCPQTRTRLKRDGSYLVSEADTRYCLTGAGVPILLADTAQVEQYLKGSVGMLDEYSGSRMACLRNRFKTILNKDYRTRISRDAFDEVITAAPADGICVSVGGGPGRPSPRLTNLNIGPFRNVDVVADAHRLPYADATVGAIYCEAVLEHLKKPGIAVQEMFRVLKPGGKVIAITPFMQGFHGYPYHFHNFTLLGHSLLFSESGFSVVDSGACVGPMYAVVGVVSGFFAKCLPRLIGLPLGILWKLAGACLTPLDLILGQSPSAHMMASTTFVVASKPAP